MLQKIVFILFSNASCVVFRLQLDYFAMVLLQ
jgi:hypothetical protein